MKLELNGYQEKAMLTAVFPHKYAEEYTALKLAGEAGEVAQVIGKYLRGDFGEDPNGLKERVKSELGDVLWYVAACAKVWGLELEEVAEYNLNKLAERYKNNTIKGSGENR